MGPLPWAWLERAARLSHKALQVLLWLCREAGCRRRCTVSFHLGAVATLGVKAKTARRGLAELERSGLVCVRRPAGRAMQVTLLTDATRRA
jgi:hypothetical protein